MHIHDVFEALWQDYTTRLCPSALQVHALLKEDSPLINDHIALRTFAHCDIGLEVLAQPFLELGYQAEGEYHFEAKHLYAKHLRHPDPTLPKVFISELQLDECSQALQAIIARLMGQIEHLPWSTADFLWQGRPWEVSYSEYFELAQESEYAAWVAAHGYGANHFTVSVNQLERFSSVEAVNDYLRQQGFTLNEAGGAVKGSSQVLLEQSSTMADDVPVIFSDMDATIPGGFYEFAKRYPQENGQLYQGFVAANADKIFESTDRQQ
ncbi:MAG: DUF1338 domain-containing protein [Vibrio sp.]